MLSKIIIALYVFVTAAALVVMKLGSTHGAPVSIVDMRFIFHITPLLVVGIVLYGISFILYSYLISKYELGYIIPLGTAFVYILIFGASYVIFGESFSAQKIAAITLILIGVSLLNLRV